MNELTIILVITIACVTADYYPVNLQGIKCTKESDLISNITCYLRVVNRTTKFINLDVYSPGKLEKVYVNAVLMRKFGSSYKQFMLNTTEDFCAYIRGKNAVVTNLVFAHIRPNMYNFKCPVQGYFGLRDAEARVDKMLGGIPIGHYRLDLNLYEGRKLFAKIKVFCSWTNKLRNK